MQWMVKDFDAQTKDKAEGHTRVLLMDGHSSHYTLELLKYAQDNNIVILGYPPHCTHVLQGLDVVCFAKMKLELRKEIHKFEDLHMAPVTKANFAGVFGRAFWCTFTSESIKAAFAATGVYPFNPAAITEKQMRVSLPTSTKSLFPLQQPSPVQAVIAAMGSYAATTLQLSPTAFTGPITGPSHITDLGSPISSPSPSRRRGQDPVIDPELDDAADTPTKRMRIFYSVLASTSLGSMLVGKT